MPSPKHTLILKAVAILGVLTIHFLSTLPINKADSSFPAVLSVVLDQLARFSVPLFIALSGYGLAIKYAVKTPQPLPFYKQRLFKLLPLYLFWSMLLYFLLRTFSFLGSDLGQYSFLEVLLFGKADYQLYFVPMILQLYLLFPLLWLILNRFGPLRLVILGLLLQAATFSVYTQLQVTDQWQYTLFLPWISYFTLGMAFTRLSIKSPNLAPYRTLLYLGLGLSAVLVIGQALNLIDFGVDPLAATRFTRYSVMFYASLALITLFYLAPQLSHLPKNLLPPLLWLGKYSYLIFLSHTLFLRLMLLVTTGSAPTPQLIVITGVSLIALITSPRLVTLTNTPIS